MVKPRDHSQYLEKTFTELIDTLDLSRLQREFLTNRWLNQLLWLERRAEREKKRYYTLRLITIVGGTLVPAIVGFNGFQGTGGNELQTLAAYAAFGISQTVAIAAAVEEFFAHGKKYVNYRNTAENLKREGWQFLLLAGPYRQFGSHGRAYTNFAQRVEQYIQQDVQSFLIQLEENQVNNKEEAGQDSDTDMQAATDMQQLLQDLSQRVDAISVGQATNQTTSETMDKLSSEEVTSLAKTDLSEETVVLEQVTLGSPLETEMETVAVESENDTMESNNSSR